MTNKPTETSEVTERLASYGEVLRGELGADDTRKRLALVVPGERPQHGLRSGLLVAAALLLVAGVTVFSLRPGNEGQLVEVAPAATVAPATQDDGTSEGDNDPAGPANADSESVESEPGQVDPGDSQAEPAEDPPDPTDPADPTDSEPGSGEATQDPTPTPTPMPTPTAVEPDSTAVCELGTLVDGRCLIEGTPPELTSSSCPDQNDVRQDEQGCYRVVPLGQTNEVVDKEPQALTCPDGYTLRTFDGQCTQPTGTRVSCAQGVQVGDQCRVEVEPIQAEPSCPVGGDIYQEDSTCYRRLAAVCGDLQPLGDDRCGFPGTVNETFVCPDGATPIDTANGDCGTVTSGEEFCPEGSVIEAFSCLFTIPAEGGFSCPVSATVFETDGRCWTIVETLPDGTCDSIEPAPGGGCIETVELVGTPLFCSGSYQLTGNPDGGPDFCTRYESVQTRCAVGEVVIDFGQCLLSAGDLVSVYTCDATGEVVPTPQDCWVVTAATCANPLCRVLADLVPGPKSCPAGYLVEAPVCVRIVSTSTSCPEGELDFDQVRCVLVASAIQPEPACPAGDDIVEIDGVCFQSLAGSCGDLATVEGGCRQPVDPLAGTSTCVGDFALVDGRCIRWEDPVVSN